MHVVWNVLCTASGDTCLLGGVKLPTASSSEHKLAPCHRGPANNLKKAPWLEREKKNFVITSFML